MSLTKQRDMKSWSWSLRCFTHVGINHNSYLILVLLLRRADARSNGIDRVGGTDGIDGIEGIDGIGNRARKQSDTPPRLSEQEGPRESPLSLAQYINRGNSRRLSVLVVSWRLVLLQFPISNFQFSIFNFQFPIFNFQNASANANLMQMQI